MSINPRNTRAERLYGDLYASYDVYSKLANKALANHDTDKAKCALITMMGIVRLMAEQYDVIQRSKPSDATS